MAQSSFLIVGVDGQIGDALWRHLKDGDGTYVTYGTSRRREHLADEMWFADLGVVGSSGAIPDAIAGWARDSTFERKVAFLAAAVTGFDRCEADPSGSRAVNVDAVRVLSLLFARHGVFTVLLSSSAVFDPHTAPPLEYASPSPVSEYGRQKSQAEYMLLDALRSSPASGHAIVRLTKVVSAKQPLWSTWLSTLREGQTIEAAEDLLLSPLSIRYVVESLVEIARVRRPGTYHLSGENLTSYHEIATQLAMGLGHPRSRVIPVRTSARSGAPLARAAALLSMAGTLLDIGIAPQPLANVISALCEPLPT